MRDRSGVSDIGTLHAVVLLGCSFWRTTAAFAGATCLHRWIVDLGERPWSPCPSPQDSFFDVDLLGTC